MTASCDGSSPPNVRGDSSAGTGDAGMQAPQILVIGADRALMGLLEEWLAAHGCEVEQAEARRERARRYDLLIVDVPHPRRGGCELLVRAATEHPDTPIVALSSAFFSGVECQGAVARELGVASVLPKPVAHDALIAEVRRLLRPAP
jgi:DNA-binding response OmpR family regulator